MRIKRRTVARSASLLAIAAVALIPAVAQGSVVTQAKKPKPPTSGPAPSTVNIGVFAPTYSVLSQEMAIGKGLYRKIESEFHTTINIEGFATPPPMVAGLEQGQLQYIWCTPANIMTAAAQGVTDFDDLFNAEEGSGADVIGSSSEKSDGTGLAAIKAHFGPGTSWAVTGLGGTSQIFIESLFAHLGFKPLSANILSVGGTGVVPAVVGGRANVGLASPSVAAPVLGNGEAYNVMFTSGLANYELTGFEPSISLTTTHEIAGQYKNLSQALVDANLAGLMFLQKNTGNPRAAYAIEDPGLKATTTLGAFVQGWGLNVRAYVPNTGLLTTGDMEIALNLGKKYGGLPATEQLPSAVDPSFLENAYKYLGLKPPTNSIIRSRLLNDVPASSSKK